MHVKKNVFFIVGILVLFVVNFFIGFGSGQASNRDTIAELEATADELTAKVTELDTTIADARGTAVKLTELRERDRSTIDNLTAANKHLGAISREQSAILDRLTESNTVVGESSGTITFELDEAVKELDRIIQSIKTGKD